MKMNYIKKIALLIPTLLLIACHDDLDQTPIDPDSFTETNVFANADEAKGALGRCMHGGNAARIDTQSAHGHGPWCMV